jgi:hypothetical protein
MELTVIIVQSAVINRIKNTMKRTLIDVLNGNCRLCGTDFRIGSLLYEKHGNYEKWMKFLYRI